jgi:WhiB family redox-sensing transcriptional regulator
MAASEITINEGFDVKVRTEGVVDLTRLENRTIVDLTADDLTNDTAGDSDAEGDNDTDGDCDTDGDSIDDPTVVSPADLVLVESDGLPPELAWQERALCAQTDPEAFFPEKGGSTREAKRVCMSCEVRAECLDYALAKDERFGIWGGLSERERRRVKKQAV